MKQSKNTQIIGLDIGSTCAKFAVLEKSGNGFRLKGFGIKDLKDANLLKGTNASKTRIIAAVNCANTGISPMIVPKLASDEMRDVVRAKAAEHFTSLPENTALDFEVLERIDEKKIKVLTACSAKETVKGRMAFLGKLGVKPHSIMPVSAALKNIVEKSQSAAGKKAQALLEMGEAFSELLIFSKTGVEFSRKIPVAGADFTKAMTGALVSEKGKVQLSFEDAEAIKCKVGIPPEAGSELIEGKITGAQVLSMLRAPLSRLADELNTCFNYYRQKGAEAKIESLTLYGAGASIKGLPEFLAKELGLNVVLGNPLKDAGIDVSAHTPDDKDAVRLAPAIGAALSEGEGINLIPYEAKEKKKDIIKYAAAAVALAALILSSVFNYTHTKARLVASEEEILVLEQDLEGIRPKLKLAKARDSLLSELAARPYWSDAFKEISNIIPEDIYLTYLSKQDELITIKGIADSKMAEKLISDFLMDLEKGIFEDVKLIVIKKMHESARTFELTCRLE